MWRILERLFALVVVAPPVFVAFRYLRWYFRDKKREEAEVE